MFLNVIASSFLVIFPKLLDELIGFFFQFRVELSVRKSTQRTAKFTGEGL